MTMLDKDKKFLGRRRFLSNAGKGLGLMALSSTVVGSLFENVQAAGKQIDHLSQIATDFAQFANIGKTRNQVFNLNDSIKHVTSLYSANDKLNITISPHAEKILIKADRTQINRLLTNLIQNAIQSVPENRDAEIEVATKEEDGKMILSVKDNGTGIPENMIGKIFTPNFTTKTSGTGLGLAMCKGIVEKLDGKIWFTTKENKYTIFFVELPMENSQT